MKDELDDLKRDRQREDARNRSAVADAEEQRKANVRQRRLEGGSRFNIRYPDQPPSSALTSEGVMAALAQYVDFGDLGPLPAKPAGQEDSAKSNGPRQISPAPGPLPGLPRKGMLLQEADALLGTPLRTAERKEGTLRVQSRQYATPNGQISADFVEGVLVRYTIASD
jgi:hypothetical protein